MITRSHLPFTVAILLAGVLTFFKIPVASSQGITIVVAQVTDTLPLSDPDSALWQEAAAVEIPLSAQTVIKPRLLNPSIRSLTVRALRNEDHLAILVEWDDETLNDQMVRDQDFRDAVALQFPLVEGQPFFCMGQQDGNVNVWHWKADWQADMVLRQDMETIYPNMYVDQYPFTSSAEAVSVGPEDYIDPNYLPALVAGNLFASAIRISPVEDLIAGGFGTLTAQPADQQNVQGFGIWADGMWRVIFSREMASIEAEDMSFESGNMYSMAFAAWDGANGERNGQKSTSQWVSFSLGGEPPRSTFRSTRPGQSSGLWMGILVLLVIAVTIFIIRIVRESEA